MSKHQSSANAAGAENAGVEQEKNQNQGREIPINNQNAANASAGTGAASQACAPGNDDEPAQNSGKATDSPAAEPKPEEKIAALEAELAEARDNLLRKAADFENFRKRMNQEKQNAIDYANQSLLLDIIPIIDDFERAIQSAEASEELKELPAGKAMLVVVVPPVPPPLVTPLYTGVASARTKNDTSQVLLAGSVAFNSVTGGTGKAVPPLAVVVGGATV